MMSEPNPRIDEDGMPWCSEEACPLFEEPIGRGWKQFCSIDHGAVMSPGPTDDDLCLVQIRLWAKERKEAQKEPRNA